MLYYNITPASLLRLNPPYNMAIFHIACYFEDGKNGAVTVEVPHDLPPQQFILRKVISNINVNHRFGGGLHLSLPFITDFENCSTDHTSMLFLGHDSTSVYSSEEYHLRFRVTDKISKGQMTLRCYNVNGGLSDDENNQLGNNDHLHLYFEYDTNEFKV